MPCKTRENTIKVLTVESSSTLVSHHRKIGDKSKSRPKDMPLASLKLAVALELKAEGYKHIKFDKIVESNCSKVKIHVLGEDELGIRLAVLCINRLEGLNISGLTEAVEVVQRAIGEDGDVAIAIPIVLLEKANDIFDVTDRVFLVDTEYRVWTYSSDSAYTKVIKYAMLRQHELSLSEKDDEKSNIAGGQQDTRITYVI